MNAALALALALALLLLCAGIVLRNLLLTRRYRQLSLRAQEQRQLTLERLRTALWGGGDGLWSLDLETEWLTIISVAGNGRLIERGFSRDQWRNEQTLADDLPLVEQALKQGLSERRACSELVIRTLDTRGQPHWTRLRGRVVESAGSTPTRAAGTFHRMDTEHEQADRLKSFERVFQSMDEAVAVTDAQFRLEQMNPAFAQLTGYDENQLRGHDARMLDSRREDPLKLEATRAALDQHGQWHGELWQRRQDGTEFLADLRMVEVRAESGQRLHIVAVMSDITDRKRNEAELMYLATRDSLTGLWNRGSLVNKIRETLKLARSQNSGFSVILVDLDRFREINDTLGHAAGDQLLARAGERLQRVLPAQAALARIGGDEFAFLQPDAHGEDAMKLALRVVDAFQSPLLVSSNEILVSPSIGIAQFPGDGESAEDLLRNADTATNAAKQRGRNQVQPFTAEMAYGRRQRLAIESALKRALTQDELHLVYQPKLALDSRRLTGVEALLRWDSKELGRISPDQFIRIAEDSGLILPISEWVLKQALTQSAQWTESGLHGIRIAVNVSTLQLQQKHFAHFVLDALQRSGVPADMLQLEITESVLMHEADHAVAQMRKLREAGVSIAIDDFGAGYSSLAYLRKLPIDTLKIDRSFVSGFGQDQDSVTLMHTILVMARALGLKVIAEGVEDDRQVEWLTQESCEEAQGFWLSPGLDPEALERFWRSYRPRLGGKVVELNPRGAT